MRKGITPIIAVIILLLVTVALAGVAWSYLQGFLIGTISKTFTIPSGGVFCDVDPTNPTSATRIISVYIVNTGYQSTIKLNDFIIAKVDGANVQSTDIAVPTDGIAPNAAGQVLNIRCQTTVPASCTATGGSFSGYHTIDLGTSGSVVHPRVPCP